jgi:hypothetical protein
MLLAGKRAKPCPNQKSRWQLPQEGDFCLSKGHTWAQPCARRTRLTESPSSGRPLHCFSYSRYDVVGVWPGSAQELCQESALSGNDLLPVDKDFKLPPPTALKFNGRTQGITDGDSETRCLRGR